MTDGWLMEHAPEGNEVHFYLSTACFHDLHDRCRVTCKFCAAPCSCDCHSPKENP